MSSSYTCFCYQSWDGKRFTGHSMLSLAMGTKQLLATTKWRKPLLIVDDSANSQMLTFHFSRLWNPHRNSKTRSNTCRQDSRSSAHSVVTSKNETLLFTNASSIKTSNNSVTNISNETTANYSSRSCDDDGTLSNHRLQVIKISKSLHQKDVSDIHSSFDILCYLFLLHVWVWRNLSWVMITISLLPILWSRVSHPQKKS